MVIPLILIVLYLCFCLCFLIWEKFHNLPLRHRNWQGYLSQKPFNMLPIIAFLTLTSIVIAVIKEYLR